MYLDLVPRFNTLFSSSRTQPPLGYHLYSTAFIHPTHYGTQDRTMSLLESLVRVNFPSLKHEAVLLRTVEYVTHLLGLFLAVTRSPRANIKPWRPFAV